VRFLKNKNNYKKLKITWPDEYEKNNFSSKK
jgi:hypothetical protein